MPRESKEITVYDLLQIPPGDDAWVNDEFRALVTDAKKGFNASPSTAVLRDPDNTNIKIKVSAFKGVDMTRYTDKVCLFSGQGMRRSEYKGDDQVTISDKTTINVVSTPNQRAASAATQPPAHQSQSDVRQPAITTVADESAKQFHRKMRKMATYWLHCFDYANKARAKLPKDAVPPELFQACVSTLYINGDRAGLIDIVPAIDAPAPNQQPAQDRSPAPARQEEEKPEHDLPF